MKPKASDLDLDTYTSEGGGVDKANKVNQFQVVQNEMVQNHGTGMYVDRRDAPKEDRKRRRFGNDAIHTHTHTNKTKTHTLSLINKNTVSNNTTPPPPHTHTHTLTHSLDL